MILKIINVLFTDIYRFINKFYKKAYKKNLILN